MAFAALTDFAVLGLPALALLAGRTLGAGRFALVAGLRVDRKGKAKQTQCTTQGSRDY
jgi:hypothetical protein